MASDNLIKDILFIFAGEHVSSKKIEEIKEAEEQAKGIVSVAQEEANSMIRKAQKEVENIRAKKVEEARKIGKKKRDEIIEESKKERDRIRNNFEEDCRKITQNLESKEEEAMSFIIEEVKKRSKDKAEDGKHTTGSTRLAAGLS